MSASSEGNNFNTILAHKLEISDDMVVQQVGWDEDCDSSISEAIEDIIGSALLEDTSYDVCDAILFWWRDGDGDLTDDLVDVVAPLSDGGVVWLTTPKTGQPDAVDPAEIAESAHTAGLSQTSTSAVNDWIVTRLVQARHGAPRR